MASHWSIAVTIILKKKTILSSRKAEVQKVFVSLTHIIVVTFQIFATAEVLSSSMDVNDEKYPILKGAIYDISPLNIVLAIHVIIHNTIIIVDYYKDRARLTSTLFMGIALSDILTAQGLLIISVISILVYRGPLDENVLDNSFYYYMITGLPGFSSSRFLNLVMSITLTVHIVDPFRRLNTTVLKRSCLAIILVLTCLHISDAALAISLMTQDKSWSSYYDITTFELPGTLAFSMFQGNLEKTFSVQLFLIIVQISTSPICMIVQVVYLRRGSVLVSDERRHASNTIMINSLLYFICQVTYFIMLIYQCSQAGLELADFREMASLILSFTEFTLPLLYAAVFPIVLICRKEELRRRYQDRLSRIIFCSREESQVPDEVTNDVTEDINHDVAEDVGHGVIN